MYVGNQNLMKMYDQCLLDAGYTIEELVDKASDCLFQHMQSYRSIALLCGPGNNGADGLSLAIKLFHNQQDVKVFIFDDHERLSQANRYYLNQCYDEDIEVILIDEDVIENMAKEFESCDAIVDAMFGFGLNSSPRGFYQFVIEEINHLYDQEIIAVDIPTGLDCNTGVPYQSVVCATQTITLSALKNGFLNPDSLFFTGNVILEKLDVEDMSEKVGLYQLMYQEDISPILKERLFHGHKGHYGRIGMITGCPQYKGASLLSTKSAVYSGSGVVTAITCQEVIDSLTIFCPEATALLRSHVLNTEDINRYDALLIGSGLGLNHQAEQYVEDVFVSTDIPLVVDGDALTILSSHLELLENQERPLILTPHMGEFKRLCHFDDEDDILEVAQNFAKEWGIILVLKGPYTMVTDGEFSYRVMSGNKAMSSGGMGDVLAGMITSFVGQKYNPIDAALLGVFIHGYAGDMIEKEAYTVIPSQLIEKIPFVMKQLKKSSQ